MGNVYKDRTITSLLLQLTNINNKNFGQSFYYKRSVVAFKSIVEELETRNLSANQNEKMVKELTTFLKTVG